MMPVIFFFVDSVAFIVKFPKFSANILHFIKSNNFMRRFMCKYQRAYAHL